MRTYENKEELKNEINKSFAKYISEFDDIPEYLKDMRVDEVDRTPAENLAYQVGWTTLVIKWESDERKGLHVKTPSDNFRWNQLGGLYQWFTDTYAHLSLQELNENINMIYEMIDSLSDEELFEPHMRKWADEATKTAVWEVYKFIHVNTVAPFGTFRTKIRKWKKIALQLGICRLIFHQSLYFQGIFAVKCQILMFCPCFYPYQPKQGQILYCPTTISSSFADFFFASLVAWAYTFIVVLTSECPRSSCTSFGCAPFSNRFVV